VLVQVLHQVFPTGLKIRQYRDTVAHRLKIILGNRYSHRFGHGDQVKHRIGAATQHHNSDNGVFKSLPGHDVRRLDIFFQQQADGLSQQRILSVCLH